MVQNGIKCSLLELSNYAGTWVNCWAKCWNNFSWTGPRELHSINTLLGCLMDLQYTNNFIQPCTQPYIQPYIRCTTILYIPPYKSYICVHRMHPCCTHELIQNSDVCTYMHSHDTPSPRSPWRRGSRDGCPSTWLGSGGWPAVRTTGDVCREVVRRASVCLKAQAPDRQTVSPSLTYVRMCTHQMLIQLQCDRII